MRLRQSPFTRLANRLLPKISLDAYRRRTTLALIRGLADLALGLRPIDLAGRVPGGRRVLVRPERLLVVAASTARLEGADLGTPVRAEDNPTTGSFHWPALGVLAAGDVYLERLARWRSPTRRLALEPGLHRGLPARTGASLDSS